MFIDLYQNLIRLAYPLGIKPYLKRRCRRGKEDLERFNERLGRPQLPRPQGRLIWFHGASVGESVSMLPLIHTLLAADPALHIMVTTGTRTSAEIMAKRLPERAFHQYIPVDTPRFTSAFLDHWQPDLVLWFESDFWPSMLSGIKARQIPLLLVNGRISDRSFRRWMQFRYIIKEILGCFSLCLGQSQQDADRLQQLGAPQSLCLGNLKYAGLPLPVDADNLRLLRQQIGNRPLWLISATHDDEENQIGAYLPALAQSIPHLLTIIAPRHPERGQTIADTLHRNYNLNVALRSQQQPITPQTDVYIADTIGEMGLWYTLSPLSFIGGSLIPHGGQNFMEPARMHNAVITGPHMHNFTDAMQRALKADAVIQVNTAEEVYQTAQRLLQNPDLLQQHQDQALAWAQAENQVLDGIADTIKGFLK